ncbi:hypothetical protein [Streptomyces sp. NPDC037389]|uniref:hypothetical protein n=1 Tax=Streptomyces sp. NPDC037389 TaxID=3155369 RepID=UPI00340A135A
MTLATPLPDDTDAPAFPPVPRRLDRTARAVPLTVLPSGLWRMAMAVGIPVGFSGQLAEDWRPGLETSSCITLLTLVIELFAFLTIGLTGAARHANGSSTNC